MRRVLAIFLDGYEQSLADRLMAEGEMPQMARLAAASARFLLDAGAAQRTGLAGEHVATGLSPEAARRWSAVHFDPRSYAVWQEGTRLRPFPTALAARTVVFDVPYFDLEAAPGVNGIVSWGAHDPGVARSASPPELLEEFEARFGTYPGQAWTYGFAWPSPANSSAMGEALAHAVDVRADAARWLLAERFPNWELALVTVSEPHSATEGLWHGLDPSHPLHGVPGAEAAGAGLRAIYRAVDRLVGSLTAAFPDARVVVFSMGGMGPNRSDVPSMLLLPELLYRHVFGTAFFRQPPAWSDAPVPLAETDSWESRVVGALPRLPEPAVRRFASRVLPRPVKSLIRRAIARRAQPTHATHSALDWMPATAYRPFWQTMPVFALPSYYDGRVRVNLMGRERHGRVRPGNYRRMLDSVEQLVRACTDPATGEGVVEFVERQALDDPLAATATQADLVFVWKGTPAGFDHPLLGRVGPVPYRRTGGHTGPSGMAYVRAETHQAGDRGTRSAFDVVPTLIDLLGEPPPRTLSGTSLLAGA